MTRPPEPQAAEVEAALELIAGYEILLPDGSGHGSHILATDIAAALAAARREARAEMELLRAALQDISTEAIGNGFAPWARQRALAALRAERPR